jgi:oligopeptidase B
VPEPTPPAAARRPHPLSTHGDTRVDDWYWLRDPEDPAVIAYLEAENNYTDDVLSAWSELQEELFQQIKRRVRETDAGPPARRGEWWYYARTVEGLQYPIMCRRPDPGHALQAADVAADARAGEPPDEQVVLDENRIAPDSEYVGVGVFDVSPDQTILAYAVDLDGCEEYTLRFRHLQSGTDLDDVIEGVYYGSAWAADSATFFYTRPDRAMRPWQIWCHVLGTPAEEDLLVFQEDDERFFIDVGLSRSRERVIIHTSSKTTSEALWIEATNPSKPEVLIPREAGVEYDVEYDAGSWLVRSNADGANFGLYRLDSSGRAVVVEPRSDVRLDGVDAFAGFLVLSERSAVDGLERLRVIERGGTERLIDQPDSVYSLGGGQNPEWDQDTYRFGYTSLVTPHSSVDYVVGAGDRNVVWTEEVSGYDPAAYRTERVWATAPDGARIPVSVICRHDYETDGSAPGILYGYGAYEMSIDPAFSVLNLNLVERGAIFAIAHVRGGGELGRAWYENGRMEHKANTFTDFVAAADALIADGWIAADRLVARGASAGGLLMGAVVNMRPDLWRAVVAEVPFVDVVTTMLDTGLPLTVTEWEEWGDPLHDPDAYFRMLSYSPYDNVEPRDRWPALYVTAGLNDPRVGFWEPAKWVAKLRSVGAGGGDRPVLLRTELGAGHGGPSGRYDTWRDEARVQAFVLKQLGLA